MTVPPRETADEWTPTYERVGPTCPYGHPWDANALLAARDATIRELTEALEPFADPYSWHINYDGGGIIFQPEGAYYESQQQEFIDAARVLLARVAAGGLAPLANRDPGDEDGAA